MQTNILYSIRDIKSNNPRVFEARRMCEVRTFTRRFIRPDITEENSEQPTNVSKIEEFNYKWHFLPLQFGLIYDEIYNFDIRPDDIWIVTFMKSGTTWMQEAAWLLMNDLNFEMAKKVHLSKRSEFLDLPGMNEKWYVLLDQCRNAKSPRLIKSHLPASLLPYKLWQVRPRVIYVARQVKDVIVSAYHYLTGVGYWKGTKDEFIEDFMHDEIMYTPYWEHIVDFWLRRNEPNIFYVTYEQMQTNFENILQQLNSFLNRPALQLEQIEKLKEHLKFDNMKANTSVNLTEKIKETFPSKVDENFEFMRSGKVGDYQNELTTDQQNRIDLWSDESLSKFGTTTKELFDYVTEKAQ